jgi:hypothetical protein
MILQTGWLLAVAINVPLPWILGYPMTVGVSHVGLPLGILAVYAAGACVCVRNGGLMWRVISGSGITAISQFWGIIHIFAGIVAIGISRAIFDPNRQNEKITRLPEAILTTILTGTVLIVASLLIGAILTLILRIHVFDKKPATPPSEKK